MDKKKFECWSDDFGDKDNPKVFKEYQPDFAAETYTEEMYEGSDPFTDLTVYVRDELGEVKMYTVYVEYEPIFSATEFSNE